MGFVRSRRGSSVHSSRVERRGTRAVAAGVALLVGGAAAPPVWASNAASGGDGVCVAEAPSAVAAREIAARCGIDVTVATLVDPWSTTVVQPDGLVRFTSSIEAERAPAPGGGWRAVDARILSGPTDGRIRMAAPAVDLTFSDGSAGEPLASMTTAEGHRLTMDVPFDLPAPVVADGQVEYLDVFPGVDLVVTPNLEGSAFTEVIRAESAEALGVPELAGLTEGGLVFPLEVSDGLKLVDASDGGVDVVDKATDQVVISAPPAAAWDSSADTKLKPAPDAALDAHDSQRVLADGGEGEVLSAPDGELIPAEDVVDRRAVAPVAGDAVAVMDTRLVGTGSGTRGVAVRLDPRALAEMRGVIHIDPKVSGTPQGRAYIQSAWPNAAHYNDTSSFGVGVCTTAIGCQSKNIYRSAFQWTTGISTIGNLNSDDIVSATFTVFGAHSYSCTASTVRLYRTWSISSSTTWSNFADASKWPTKLGEKSIAHKPACNNARDIEWDIKSAAEYTAANNASQLTLGLMATSTTDAVSWKRYENPRIEIVFNRLPNAPLTSDMKITQDGNTYACKTSAGDRVILRSRTGVTMRAVGRDPDSGDQVRLRYVVVNNGTGAWAWESPWTVLRTAPATFDVTVPSASLSDNVTYRWRVEVQDSRGRTRSYSSSPACYFEVDLTSPATPSVSSVEYPEDQIGGSQGQAGTFTINSSNTPDVVNYRYSWDSTALNLQKAPTSAGGSVQVAFPATLATPGSHYLKVQSVDNAGRPSATLTYKFSIDFPTTAAFWHLDEESGTTALDSAPHDDGSAAHHLSVSSTVARVPGAFNELSWGDPYFATDRALRFVGDPSGVVHSDGPVINMFGCYAQSSGTCDATDDGSGTGPAAGFTVMAFLRPDAADNSTQAAVSQDAVTHAGFKMGRLGTVHCPTGADGLKMTTCWGVWMYTSDGGSALKAISAVPVAANSWTHVTGVYDQARDELQVYVCELGTAEQPRDSFEPLPGQEMPTPYTGTRWTAGGDVQLGRGRHNGAYQEHWKGVIDDVRLYDHAIDISEIRQVCGG